MNRAKPAHIQLLTISLAMLCLLPSCVKEANLEVDFKPSLVAISTIAPYYIFQGDKTPKATVLIGETKSPEDNTQFRSLSNAEVEVAPFIRSGPNTIVYNNNCNCYPANRDNLKITVGNDYYLKAFVPGFDTIYAETTIPKASKVSNGFMLDFEMDYSIKNENKINFTYNLKFRLDHDLDAKYYHLIFHHDFDNIDPNLHPNDPAADGYIYTLDPKYSDGFAYTKHYDRGILVDREDLANRTISLSFSDFTAEVEPLLGVWVEVRTVNEEYYLYHESISRQKLVRQDPFAEPVTIFNNIQKGYGNFSAYNLEYLYIPLEN